MQYFRDKGGSFHSTGVPGMGGSSAARLIGGLVPILVLGIIYVTSSSSTGMKLEQMFPFYIAGGILVLSLGLSLFLRNRGLGTGIVVDQMSGTVSFKRPGSGSRRKMSLTELDEITLLTTGSSGYSYSSGKGPAGATVSLRTMNGQSHLLSVSRDLMKMRGFADELAILTSLSVNEVKKQS